MTPETARKIYFKGEDAVVNQLCDLHKEIKSLKRTIKKHENKIAYLSKDSSTSSKPPSSDITKPPKTTGAGNSGKPPKKRKIGAQPGHTKHVRDPYAPEDINFFIDHSSVSCPHCGTHDIEFFADEPPKIIQQVDIIEVPVVRYEHKALAYWCNTCQQFHYADFPPDIMKEQLFKARITALVAYMKNVCHSSFSTIRKYIRDVLGEKVSRGQLAKLIQKVSESLEKPYDELLQRIPLESNLNIDETGHKENKERFWTWVFKAELYVLFKIDKSRGSKVLIDVLGKEFEGVIGCDYFSAYRKYLKDFNVTVQFCIAHLIRDIKFLCGLPDPSTKDYGEKLLTLVKDMFKTIHQREDMSEEDFKNALQKSKETILDIAINDAPSHINEDGKEDKREAQNMANRFRKHGKEYFQFITTPGMDPTNNVAEQAIRFIVIDRYVTQGTRSIKGRQANERLWTVIATCALQGRSAFNFILQAVKAHFNNTPPPSLIAGVT